MFHPRTLPTVSSLAALAALVLALVAGVMTTPHGADAADVPRFATVARQTLPLAADAIVWQLTESDAFPDSDAAVPFAPGFLYAPDAALEVFRDGSDRVTPVRPDRALAIRDATPLAPTAADRATPTVFLALEILAEADAVTPAGDPFELIKADYNLQLLRATLPADGGAQSGAEPLTLDERAYPVLLVVVAGEIELTADGADPQVLATRAAVTVDGHLSLTQSGEADAVVLAVTLRQAAAGGGIAASITAASGGSAGGNSPRGARPNASPSASPSPSPSASPSPSPSPSPPPTRPCPGDPERTICPSPAPSPAGNGGGGDAVVHADDPLPCVSCLPDTLDPNAQSSSRVDFDPDDDGLDNDAEDTYGSGRNVWDTDADALGDGAEVYNFGTSPLKPDTDDDGLTDWDEIYTTYTDPLNADSDGDGLIDGVEYNSYRTDPSARDTDGDCLNDGFEVQSLGTSPHLQDTDGDGVLDSSEYGNSDPLNPDDAYDGRGWQCAE